MDAADDQLATKVFDERDSTRVIVKNRPLSELLVGTPRALRAGFAVASPLIARVKRWFMMRPVVLSVVVVGLILGLTSGRVEAAAITYARYFVPAVGIDEVFTTNAATTVDFATLDIVSDFGVNRLSITSKESSGTSAWLDEWTVVDAALTGTAGTLSVDWSLDGTLSVTDSLACANCDSASIQYTSLFGASGVLSTGTQIAFAEQVGTGTRGVDLSGTLIVPFIYGTAFNAGFRLSGGVGDDLASGSVNFFDSALITAVTIPNGAALVTGNTRVSYPVAQEPPPAPVPEPGTLFLLAIGLAGAARRQIPRTLSRLSKRR